MRSNVEKDSQHGQNTIHREERSEFQLHRWEQKEPTLVATCADCQQLYECTYRNTNE